MVGKGEEGSMVEYTSIMSYFTSVGWYDTARASLMVSHTTENDRSR